ncbi:MAG: TlpA disulfide reductase family protein [Gammaproteobacteria bacterium]|jgi:thiol-disulfide isomerase/thioredoxin|nr:TlpA disulfide reductase family protein [Gammaproteobacteria bacterium]
MRRKIQIVRWTLIVAACLTAGLYFGRNLSLSIDDSGRLIPQPDLTNAATVLPDFVLSDLNGVPRPISDWSGQPILINFWATWCAPCRREMPLLQKLHEEFGNDGLQVIGIAIDRAPDVSAFTIETGITYPILVGQEDAIEVTDGFGLDFLGLPFTVLVDQDGQILKIQLGELHADDLKLIVAVTAELRAGEIGVNAARQRLQAL